MTSTHFSTASCGARLVFTESNEPGLKIERNPVSSDSPSLQLQAQTSRSTARLTDLALVNSVAPPGGAYREPRLNTVLVLTAWDSFRRHRVVPGTWIGRLNFAGR
jgi:hypothetical protein